MPPLSTPQTPQAESPNYLLRVAVIVLTLTLVGVACYFGYESYKKTKPVNQKPNQVFLNLKENADFREAQSAISKKDYATALAKYKEVQPNGNNEYSFIQYEIANALLNIDRNQGIQAFSDVVASSSINSQTKGYAVNALARTYSTFHDQAILDTLKRESLGWGATSTSELIQKLESAENYDDAYIALLEIGSAFYPIMDSEMRLAFAYAKKAIEAKNNTEEVALYRQKAIEKIKSGDSDQNNTKLSENLSWMLPLAMNRKAMTLELLQRIGVSTENPELYFEQALNLSKVQGAKVQPFILFHYSTFLIKTGGDTSKIVSLLQAIVEHKDTLEVRNFKEFTKNAYKNNEVINIQDLDALAKIYPPFGEIIR